MGSPFVHLKFLGKTESLWHVGKRIYQDYHYTRTDYLWGRGIRGPVLRQLWRTYCPKSDPIDSAKFNPNEDCVKCENATECPFNNLRGSLNEGEFKDKPKLIFSNLKFKDGIRTEKITLISESDEFRAVGKGPVHIECLPKGVSFEFEVILMADGTKFIDEFKRAVKISLDFFGWGGFCNEGLGRGRILKIEESSFKEFESKYVDHCVQKIMSDLNEKKAVTMSIVPLLILERKDKTPFSSVIEEGFKEKLSHSINERYWQFYNGNIYVPIVNVFGNARATIMRSWSRKDGREINFKGLGGRIQVEIKEVSERIAKALSLVKYGIGRYKNMGFGQLSTEQ